MIISTNQTSTPHLSQETVGTPSLLEAPQSMEPPRTLSTSNSGDGSRTIVPEEGLRQARLRRNNGMSTGSQPVSLVNLLFVNLLVRISHFKNNNIINNNIIEVMYHL